MGRDSSAMRVAVVSILVVDRLRQVLTLIFRQDNGRNGGEMQS